MNNVTLYVSKVSYSAITEMLGKLKTRNVKQNHIILTPDRCNFNIENLVFDILGEDSLFDVNVMTLSRFASMCIGKSINDKRILTMQGACSIIQRLLIENKEELKSFSKSLEFKGFSKELFETISSFKSCHITPNEINADVNSLSLANKLHDIKLIYSKYEDYLQNDYTDSFNRLNLLANVIDDKLNNTHIYFAGFDDFTPQQYGVIAALIKHAASVNIATTKSTESNKSIYLNNIYYNILDVCSNLGIKPEVINIIDKLSKAKDFLSKYAFAHGGSGKLGDYIALNEFDNIGDEVLHVVSSIAYMVMNNSSEYDNYAILVPSFDKYEELLRTNFAKFGVPYFVDKPKHLSDMSSFAYISKLIQLPIDVTREKILDFVHNAYLALSNESVCTYERRIIDGGLFGDAIYQDDDVELCNVLKVLQSIDTGEHSVSEHIASLLDTLTSLHFSKNLNDILSSYQNDDIMEYRLISQTQNKLSKVINELNGVLGDYVCSYNVFAMLMCSYIQNVSVALPPITSSVFIGDQVSSYIGNKKYVYMLGVNEGSVPMYNADLGIISDDEIDKLNKKISPTIAYINKKHRYKVFENLFAADNKLIISYINMTNDGEKMYPSSFVVNLKTMGDLLCNNGSAECDSVFANYNAIDTHNIIFNNFNKNQAQANYVNMLKLKNNVHNDNFDVLVGTLRKALNDDEYLYNLKFKNIKHSINGDNLYFKHGKSSISQVQKYYECPYKHFASYGLRLKENITGDIRPVDFGNIVHSFLEIAVARMDKDTNVYMLTDDTLTYVLEMDEYKAISHNTKNIYDLKALRNECVRMLKAIKYQLQVGDYKPTLFEHPFEGKQGIKVVVNGKKVVFGGKIDRIDTYNNTFRVIDYKTGDAEFSDYGNVASGVRLQLIMYLKAYMDSTHMQPVGAFYLPISTEYNKENTESVYRLRGVLQANLEQLFDHNLNKPSTNSCVIKANTDKDGLLTATGANMRISREDFDLLTDYVYKMLVDAVDSILSGNIQPEPYKDGSHTSCDYCPYLSLCNFNEKYGNSYREKPKIKTINELRDYNG